ncbi:MAG: 50S ribosomal protein L9 [Candidatus Omnitrophica bacterium]|nr:50S ribosomal protein L9 [Candidatus Omnitrophota bacterium]
MEVILTQDDPKLGRRGELIKVADGHARNYLVPRGKAVPATPSNLKRFNEEKSRRQKREAAEIAEARAVAEKLEKNPLSVEVLAGEGDKLFGAVTTQEIAQQLAAQGIKIDKKSIQLEEPIRKLGMHTVSVKLYPEVSAVLKLSVVKKKN